MKFLVNIIVSILVLIFPFDGQSQEILHSYDYEIDYRLDYQTDTNNASSRKQEFMKLFWSKGQSLFLQDRSYRTDSVLYFHQREKANTISSSGIKIGLVNKFAYRILKGRDSITTYDPVFGKDINGYTVIYKYNEPKSDLKWEFSRDTMTIAGHLCNSATVEFGGRTWKAYYSTDIPIDDGPYKFCGLPGLIFKISDQSGTWDFSLIRFKELHSKKEIAINFQKGLIFQNSSKEELLRKRMDFQQNLLPHLRTIYDSDLEEGIKTRYLDQLKTDNNWIEILR